MAPARVAVVDDSGALATLDERGDSRVSYPAPGVVFGFPAWSPDGSRIAVVGQSAVDTAVYVFTVDRDPGVGREPLVVYRSRDRPPFYLYWTPDSRHVSFLTGEPIGFALRVAPVDGRALLEAPGGSVIRQGAPLYLDWVDADRVLLHVGVGTDAFVGQVGLDGVGVGPPIVATGIFRPASLSRDGRYVAYARSVTEREGEIVVETADGSARHRFPAFGPAAMLFNPAGDILATVAADEPATESPGLPLGPLRLIDPASGTVRTVLDGPVVGFVWSPDGRTIAALRVDRQGPGPVAVAHRVVLARAEVTPPAAGGSGQAAGTTVDLAFVDVLTGAVRSERAVSLADYFVSQLLPYFDQYALSHRLWSPDSASILLPLVGPSGRDQLVVIPADGSDPRPIADGAKGSWSP